MRTYLPLLLLLTNALAGLQAQNHDGSYGHEWIQYNQTYYKFKVAEDGFYRISAATLQASGVSISNPNELQLFRLGQEVPIYAHTNNGVLEYVEFYGEKHKGEFDKNLYYNPDHHYNQNYSVITDTMAYFMTTAPGNHARYAAQSANLSNLPPKENFFWSKSNFTYTNTWSVGKRYQISTERLSKSTFEYGEGFGSASNTNISTSVPTPFIYTAGPQADVRVRLYAAGLGNTMIDTHHLELRVGNTLVSSFNLARDSVATAIAQYSPTLLGAASTSVNLRAAAGTSTSFSISHVDINYPRQFNFGGATVFRFTMRASAARQYLEMTNLNGVGASGQTIYLYDLTNRLRIQCFWDGSKAMTDLPPSAVDRELVVVNFGNTSGSYRPVVQLQPVAFTDYSAYDYVDYWIVTHPSLRNDGQGDPVLEYAAYRASKGFNPQIANILELYDQFAYGLDYHPLAVRNFALYLRNTRWGAGGIPRYLFLIGKGREYDNIRITVPNELKIPVWGYPTSDQIGTAAHGSTVPAAAVGRLAATSAAQVRIYLDKMRTMENNLQAPSTPEGRAWTKNILHLGGGSDSYQQNLIANHLNAMKATAEDALYGAHVESFFKTSSSPIQAAQSAFLDSLINTGVSMITFFGHSSANSFDFNLDYPSDYDNYGKYPLILALGCYGGSMSGSGQAISEQFIFEPDAGASVFLASVGASALSALNVFAQQFYVQMSGGSYGKGGGRMVQEAIRYLENTGWINNSTTVQMVCQYMAYHGDPAFNLNAHERPDYYIGPEKVSHSPAIITTQIPEFTLHLDVQNLGQAIDTVFYVEVTRQYADGQTQVMVSRQQMTAPYHSGSIALQIPVDGANPNTLGINLFTIEIDADEEIEERPNPNAENNNIVIQYAVHILSDAVLPVYPYEFAIVPTPTVELKASTGITFAPVQTYRLQIDTTEYFNSNQLRETTITQAGGVLEWTPPFSFTDSTVYYWRVSVDSVATGAPYQWAYSSFIYLDGSYPGWNQSHYFQYHKDEFRNIELPENTRDFQYVSSLQELTLTNGFTPVPLLWDRLATYLNGNFLDKCRCPYWNGVYVQVVDSSDLSIWELPGPFGNMQHGAINCDGAGRNSLAFLFQTLNNPVAQDSLLQFLQTVIPDGYYVLVYSLNNAGADGWSSPLISELIGQGADAGKMALLQTTSGGLPFAFYYQKNTPAFPYRVTEVGATQNDIIEVSGLIPGSWYKGYLESTIIGPAVEWTHLYWDHSSLDNLPTDATDVKVYGLDATGNSSLLIESLTDLDTSLTAINPQIYPYLQLQWHSADQPNKTAPQLDYWRIQAALVPEAALRPDVYVLSNYDTVQRGQDYHFRIAMENISSTDMDSMLVKFLVLGDSLPSYQRLAPLPSGDTLWAVFSTSTLNRYGLQQLLIEINPNDDQPEQYHFNNIGLYRFYVEDDHINPVLDVTFDGVHIMNGDIVSGQPEIQITLTDENRYLGLDELDDFSLILRHPSLPNGEMALSTATTNLQFMPGTAGAAENRAKILVRPDLVFDGTYTLFVSAQDRSGNNSGKLSYNIDFEVINKPSISNVLNYPNPFTTSTQFVFTLTGRELPDAMKIQIMNINGQVVREITQEELGEMRIGINRSEFAWDGTDQYGDRLANGVYLYRVIAIKDGSEYDLYQNNKIDHYFHNGFGKMYLMR